MKKFYSLFFGLLLLQATSVFAQVQDTSKTHGQAPPGNQQYQQVLHPTIQIPQQASQSDTGYKPVLPLYRDVVGDTTVISKGNRNQEKNFETGLYPFPPKPRNKWEVGLGIGGLFISGDVPTRGGIGGQIYGRKSFGYVLSFTANYLHGTTYGLNWKGNKGLANNPVLNGSNTLGKNGKPINYFQNGNGVFFYNYKCDIDELTLNALFTLNNIGYHKQGKDRKFDIYGGFGGGAMLFATWYNALDANGNQYDFNAIYESDNYSNRSKTIAALKKMLDNTYETPAEGQPDNPSFLKRTFKPVIDLQFGVGIHLSKRFTLTIMEKVSIVNSDLLDGDQWQEHPLFDPALTPGNDVYHFVSVSLGYFIGGHKRVEPLYWQNPQDYTYDALQTLVKKNVDQLIDSDGDGVPDKLDWEPNSPPGAIVDSHGRTKDSDGDGVPDYKDKSPFDVPEAKGHVDSLGVPLDSDHDGVPDYRDLEPNTPPGSLVDVNGRAINPASAGGTGNGTGMGNWFLPAVFFDLDKDVIKPEMYIQMRYVATVLALHPELKIVAYGNTDIRASDKYNEDLSMRRANHAKDFLVKNYDIDPSRVITKWDGKRDPLIKGLPDRYDPKYEGQQYFNRRVEFRIYDPKVDK